MTGQEFREFAALHRRYMKLPSPWGTGPELVVIAYDVQPPEFEDKGWYRQWVAGKNYWIWPCCNDKYAIALWGGITVCDVAIPLSEQTDDMFCVYAYKWISTMGECVSNAFGVKRDLHYIIAAAANLVHDMWDKGAA